MSNKHYDLTYNNLLLISKCCYKLKPRKKYLYKMKKTLLLLVLQTTRGIEKV